MQNKESVANKCFWYPLPSAPGSYFIRIHLISTSYQAWKNTDWKRNWHEYWVVYPRRVTGNIGLLLLEEQYRTTCSEEDLDTQCLYFAFRAKKLYEIESFFSERVCSSKCEQASLNRGNWQTQRRDKKHLLIIIRKGKTCVPLYPIYLPSTLLSISK